jgi:hypothetical protein
MNTHPDLPKLPPRTAALAERLHDSADLDTRVAAAVNTELLHRAVIITGGGPAAAPGLSDEAKRTLETGVDTIKKLDPGAALSPAQYAATEAVIHLTERPALLVQNDNFPTPVDPWTILDKTHRKPIRQNLPRVGRIEITVDGNRTMNGTGFVVGPDLILTNHHVVDHPFHKPIRFGIQAPGGTWEIVAGKDPTIDFKFEYEVPEKRVFKIKEIVAMHPKFDMCLLRVDPNETSGSGAALPKPLKMASDEPVAANNLYVVGYPGGDNSGETPFKVLKEIFGNIFEVKRLQPGKLFQDFPSHGIFAHDCSTLGGNSGSCVVDLKADRVVGIHFSGNFKEANWAVALWRLDDDPFFSDHGIEHD